MVNIQINKAATSSATNATFAHKFSLAYGFLGLQELESTLSFPLRNGRSWTVSVKTSDLAILLLTILTLTYQIDKHLFKSRYLVHIGGVRKEKDEATVLDEKASLHEKEALNVESGLKCSNDEDCETEPKSQPDPASPASTARPGRLSRAIKILAILSLVTFYDGKNKKESPSTAHKEALESPTKDTGPEGEMAKSRPTSRWGRFLQHPVSEKILGFGILLLLLLFMTFIFAYHLLFWPLFLAMFIAFQCVFYEEVNTGVAVPWQSIALTSTLCLAIWTIIGAYLLLKPNRSQGTLWKYVKWCHAVNWWLFWSVYYSHYIWGFVARRTGFHYDSRGMMELGMFFLRPTLVAYLYSGAVRDAFVAVRLCKLLWNYDLTKA